MALPLPSPHSEQQPSAVDATAESQRGGAWGRLPLLAVASSCGLLIVAAGDAAARHGTSWAEGVFWLGLVAVYAPIAWRLVSGRASERETAGLVIVLGIWLYLIKLMHSPLNFTFHDEFLHWRTAEDILATHHLFRQNPLLPISALYPSMEIVASAIANTTRLGIFPVGVLLISVCRLVLVLGLYLFFRTASRSHYVAGLASLLYMTNPNFLFFGAMFKYESLALALVAVALVVIARRTEDRPLAPWGPVVTLLLVGAIATTHHLSSYAFTGFLLFWTATALLVGRFLRVRQANPAVTALVAVLANLVWLLYVADLTIGYLAPQFEGAVSGLLSTIAGERSGERQLFRSSAGAVAPLWERLTGISSVLVILILMPFGLWAVWRYRRTRALPLTLALSSLLYPASLALRFTGSGWEIANRSSEFVYIGVGFVVAYGIAIWRPIGVLRPLRTPVVSAAACIMLVGGVIAGWTPILRIPGPYMAAAAARSIDEQSSADAEWTRAHLGVNNRIAGDQINNLLMGSAGRQFPVSTLNGGVDVSWLFYSPQFGPDQWALLRKGRIRYVVTDRRLLRLVPFTSPYEGTDPRAASYRGRPLPAKLFAKFDRTNGFSRVLDSGGLVIYRVSSRGEGNGS